MLIQSILNRYEKVRYNIFIARNNANILLKILFSLLMACFTGLMAQIKVYIPWSPVPLTGQTFAVMSGALLGSYWGALSQILYIIFGIAGVPWFADAKAGIAVLAGPTGGYLFGFIFASFLLGYFSDNFVKARNFFPMLLIMSVANFGLVFIPGLAQLALYLTVVKGAAPGIIELLFKGLIPFIPGDIIKIIIASGITTFILPKKEFKGI